MDFRWFHGRDDETISGNIRNFSYKSLQKATENFSDNRLISQDGYAKVYMGNLSNGIQVAVKFYTTKLTSSQREEILHMVEILSMIQHQNIGQVMGCCIEKDHVLLVTEYVDNGTLWHLIAFPKRRESSNFNWHRRAGVCIDMARGLSYLHYDAIRRVIHMDFKPENILLDHNFTPKITGFGLMKPFYQPEESVLSHEKGIITGSGYKDPEYVIEGKYSDKSDVYSFGLVMLEIISGREASRHRNGEHIEENIVVWASKLVRNDRVLEIIDPLMTDVVIDDARSFIIVALLCAQRDPKQRPNMVEVKHLLYGVCNSSSLFVTRPDVSLLYDAVYATLCGSGYYIEDSKDEGRCSYLRDTL